MAGQTNGMERGLTKLVKVEVTAALTTLQGFCAHSCHLHLKAAGQSRVKEVQKGKSKFVSAFHL